MTRKELIDIVDAAWQKHKTEIRKYLGCKHNFPHIYFTTYLGKNTCGYEDSDRSYVVSQLKNMGVDEQVATEYFNQVIKDNY